MKETDSARSWFARRTEYWCKRGRMKLSERGGEVAGILGLLLVTLFFVYHQLTSTGFFTSAFGPLEMVLFYAPVPIAIAVSGSKIITASRNAARPIEIVEDVSWMATGFWLFLVFPFDFSHLAGALPASLQFLLSWIPNWVGRAVVPLTGVVGVGNTIYISTLYLSVRRELSGLSSSSG